MINNIPENNNETCTNIARVEKENFEMHNLAVC